MNVKFILFCIASLGSLMMFYIWFTMNSSFKDSQNIEEQYLYRISALKSEIDVERRLMESLRKEWKTDSQDIKDKNSTIENMKKTNEKIVTLENEIDTLKLDLEKISKSNEEQKKNMESETESKVKEDNLQIDNLESEIKKLLIERDELLAKQNKAVTSVIIQNSDVSNNHIDNTMQGKAPKIKEIKVEKISQKKTLSKPDEVIDKPNIESDKNQVTPHNSNKLKPKEIHIEPHVENIQHMKSENPNDLGDLRDGYFRKRPQNSKIMENEDDWKLPENQANIVKDFIQKNKDNQHAKLIKDDLLVNHQLKPPKNDKEPKKAEIALKNREKKETINDNEKDM